MIVIVFPPLAAFHIPPSHPRAFALTDLFKLDFPPVAYFFNSVPLPRLLRLFTHKVYILIALPPPLLLPPQWPCCSYSYGEFPIDSPLYKGSSELNRLFRYLFLLPAARAKFAKTALFFFFFFFVFFFFFSFFFFFVFFFCLFLKPSLPFPYLESPCPPC